MIIQRHIIMMISTLLNNPSDITRCIFLNLQESLHFSSTLNTAQLGSAIQCYLRWFTTYAEQAFTSWNGLLRRLDA